MASSISYDWASATLVGEVPFEVSVGLDAFFGAGVGTVVGAGAYGNADLAVDMQLFQSPFFKAVDLTGELGLKAYVGPFEYSKTFAHNTWHLYTANSVGTMSLMGAGDTPWNEGHYDSEQYAPADLSYLRDESDWLGTGGFSLMAAEANTEFKPLLTDTYRDARPVMISTADGLYAAFIRADAEGKRYVAVTKSADGINWSEPVRADADAILDSAPVLCADEAGTVWLAYAKTVAAPENSLLSWAENQEIVVGSIDPDTLKFTVEKTYDGAGYAHLQALAVVNGQPVLAWMDSAVTDDNSVLRPEQNTLCYTVFSNGNWGTPAGFGTVNAPVDALCLGASGGAVAAAYSSGNAIYRLSPDGTPVLLTEQGSGVRYGVLPGETVPGFYWIADGALVSEGGTKIPVAGISGEYAVAGNSIYYSMAENSSANLAALKYDNGHWGQPIVLTGDSRYLENLSAARWNGNDYVLGMHTAVTIDENTVEDAKNLVWSRVMPVSDVRLEDISFDDSSLTPGTELPLTLTVTNAGDHTVNSIELTQDGNDVKTIECSLLPGQSLEISETVICPDTLTAYLYNVSETGRDDYSPEDNAYTVKLGYADVATELVCQQIGGSKALVAEVTNLGVEPASGSVVFYDADGKEAAVSTFENLASGDTAIATFALDGDFKGFSGGDVSAVATLEQEEYYTYNNGASLFLSEGATEIRQLSTGTGNTVEAEIYCDSDTAANAYCAFYSDAGQMLRMESAALEAGAENALTFAVSDAASAYVKVFVLNADRQPVCASVKMNTTGA